MNTSALLNKKTNLVQTTSVLRKEIKLSFLNDIRNQTKLLDQKKKLSEKRIFSLRSIGESFKQQRRGDQITESVASGAGLLSLLGGGVGGVKGRPSVTGNKIVKFNRIKPSRLSGLRGRLNLRGIGKGNVVANTLLAGFDFASRSEIISTNISFFLKELPSLNFFLRLTLTIPLTSLNKLILFEEISLPLLFKIMELDLLEIFCAYTDVKLSLL